jgi:hypothetical protein
MPLFPSRFILAGKVQGRLRGVGIWYVRGVMLCTAYPKGVVQRDQTVSNRSGCAVL